MSLTLFDDFLAAMPSRNQHSWLGNLLAKGISLRLF